MRNKLIILFVLVLGLSFISFSSVNRSIRHVNASNSDESDKYESTEPPEKENEIESMGDDRIGVENREDEANENEGKENENTENEQNRTMIEAEYQIRSLFDFQNGGDLGDKVREMAEEQERLHNQAQNIVKILDARKEWLKFFVGTNFSEVKSLEELVNQNKERIEQFEEIKNQLQNNGDTTKLEETITALNRVNLQLEEKIRAERSRFSLLGWLFKLFEK